MSRPRDTAIPALGAFLRFLREHAGLSTAEVAQRAKRSRATCYRVEQGTSADHGLVVDFARGCGATEAEILRARVLLARQSGSIVLPKRVTDEQIQAALAALGAL